MAERKAQCDSSIVRAIYLLMHLLPYPTVFSVKSIVEVWGRRRFFGRKEAHGKRQMRQPGGVSAHSCWSVWVNSCHCAVRVGRRAPEAATSTRGSPKRRVSIWDPSILPSLTLWATISPALNSCTETGSVLSGRKTAPQRFRTTSKLEVAAPRATERGLRER